MRQMTVFTLLILLFSQSALAICKLNQSGHNICSDEKALFPINQQDKNVETINEKYHAVKVKKIYFRERKALIKGKNIESQEVHIDDLIGNQLCEEDDALCAGDRVVIRKECIDPNLKNTYKLEQKYENDIVELTTGGLFFSKSFLTSSNCIDSIE